MYLLKSISPTFYVRILLWYFAAQKSQSQTVIREKLRKALSYKKRAHKMLMKLMAEVDFTNIFGASKIICAGAFALTWLVITYFMLAKLSHWNKFYRLLS